MKLDRTKHNKFKAGAVYGNTTSGGIMPSSSPAHAGGVGGSTVIIQGGGYGNALTEVSMGTLTNVGTWADEAATEDRILVQLTDSAQWSARPVSDITGGTESNLTKLDNSYFDKLFVAIDAEGNEIDPNNSTTEIASIKARYGFWTEHFISVKGTYGDSGTDNTPYSHLHELQDVHLNQPVYNGQMLVYRNGYWVNETVQTGGTIDDEDLAEYAKRTYVDSKIKEVSDALNNKVDCTFLARMFSLIDENGESININDIETIAKSIKANYGLWTEEYLSALGYNSSGGSANEGGTSVLEKDLLVTTSVGYYSNGNIITKGTSWEEIFRKMMYRPTAATLSGKISTSTDVEYGSNKGTLTYTTRRNDSGAMTSAYYDGNTANLLSFSAENSSGQQTATRTLSGQYTARETYKATVTFAANEVAEVAAVTRTSTISVNVYRKWFAGIIDAIPTTSAEIRSLTSGGLYKGAGTYSFNIGNWTKFVICIPSGEMTSLTLTAYPGNFVEDTSVCQLYGTIMVEGANGSIATEYKMYLIQAETENDADKFTFKTN